MVVGAGAVGPIGKGREAAARKSHECPPQAFKSNLSALSAGLLHRKSGS